MAETVSLQCHKTKTKESEQRNISEGANENLKVKTGNRPQVWENMSNQVMIGFTCSFTFD